MDMVCMKPDGQFGFKSIAKHHSEYVKFDGMQGRTEKEFPENMLCISVLACWF